MSPHKLTDVMVDPVSRQPLRRDPIDKYVSRWTARLYLAMADYVIHRIGYLKWES
jgi:hypothetical protein